MGLSKGLIQVYHGNGKGKTTAAFGLAFRAAGQGLRVEIIQFMKEDSSRSGEVKSAEQFSNIRVRRFGGNLIGKASISVEQLKPRIAEGISLAKKILLAEKTDLLILDEINVALHFKLVELTKVVELLDLRPTNVELILTGRYPPQAILDKADLVTEMKLEKHPYETDEIKARRGIEF
jgi:cob(I)alamin adenosyltransferase